VRAFSVLEIVQLRFGFAAKCSLRDLLAVLSKYRIEDFACVCFRRHRLGNVLTKAFIPIESITSFTSIILKRALLRSVPSRLKKVETALFDLVLQYTAVKQGDGTLQTRGHILRLLKEHPVLINELYFQLIKQTTNNDNGECLAKTWELFAALASVHAASKDCDKWILAHVARSAADHGIW
jgi:hypothetical protein